MHTIQPALPYRPVLRPFAQFGMGFLLGLALGGPFAAAGVALGELGSHFAQRPQALVAIR